MGCVVWVGGSGGEDHIVCRRQSEDRWDTCISQCAARTMRCGMGATLKIQARIVPTRGKISPNTTSSLAMAGLTGLESCCFQDASPWLCMPDGEEDRGERLERKRSNP